MGVSTTACPETSAYASEGEPVSRTTENRAQESRTAASCRTMYIPLQLSCLHNGGGCYQRYAWFQDVSGAVVGRSRNEGTRYQAGAKPDDGRRSRPRTPARLFMIRAPARAARPVQTSG